MTSALRHLADMIGYAATRRRHDQADAAAVSELTVDPAKIGLPPGVDLRWLGAAGFALRHEGTTVLIDPYVTRIGVREMLRSHPVVADRALIDRWLPRADAVLVGHTHFDHALDAPAVARRDGCPVYGSASAARLMALHGLGPQAVEVEPHRTYEIGPFAVSFVPSAHDKLLLGRSVLNGGEITCEHLDDLSAREFQCGQSWGIRVEVAGATLYHQGFADLIDAEVRGEVDVFLCGIAGRQFTQCYLPRVLGRLDPHTIVMSHHDNFYEPVDATRRFGFGVDVADFPDQVAAVSHDFRVVALPDPRPIDGPAG